MHLFVLLCVLLLVYVLYRIHSPRGWAQVRHLNGPKVYPVVGTLPHQWGLNELELTKLTTSLHRQYKSPMKMKQLNRPLVQIYRADQTEVIYKSKANIAKPFFYGLLYSWLGEGLLTTGKQNWYKQRRILTPAFHFDILKQFVPIMDDHCRLVSTAAYCPDRPCGFDSQRYTELSCSEMVDWIDARCDRAIDIRRPCTLMALDMIAETSFGRTLNCLIDCDKEGYSEGKRYSQAIQAAQEAFMTRLFRPWLMSDRVYYRTQQGKVVQKHVDFMHQFAYDVMTTRESAYHEQKDKPGKEETTFDANGNKKRLCLVDVLIKMKEEGQLNDVEMREEVDTFMFTGHDTTATSVIFALFSAAHHDKKFQRELQEELDDIIGDNYDLPITNEHVSRMVKLERFIKESQRLYPAVPVWARHITEPVTIDGAAIQPDTTVVVHIRSLHRDPEQFPEPDRFDPDRFLPEVAAKRHPFAFAPFSAGARNCIGQRYGILEVKMALAHLLYNFNLSTEQRWDDLQVVDSIVATPQQPVSIKFERRKPRPAAH